MIKKSIIPITILSLALCGYQGGNAKNDAAQATSSTETKTAEVDYSHYLPREIENVYETADGEINIYKYVLNEYGFLVSYQETDTDGNVVEWETYEIVADENGCPIEITEKGSGDHTGHLVAEKQMIDGKEVYVFNDEPFNEEMTVMYLFDTVMKIVKPAVYADCAILLKDTKILNLNEDTLSKEHKFAFTPEGEMHYTAYEAEEDGTVVAKVETHLNSYGATVTDDWYLNPDYYFSAGGDHGSATYTSEGMRYLTAEQLDPESGEMIPSEFAYDKKTIDGVECYCTSEKSDAAKRFTYTAEDNRLLGYVIYGADDTDTFTYTY